MLFVVGFSKQGHFYIGMSQNLTETFHVKSLPDTAAGKIMPQHVEPEPPYAAGFRGAVLFVVGFSKHIVIDVIKHQKTFLHSEVVV